MQLNFYAYENRLANPSLTQFPNFSVKYQICFYSAFKSARYELILHLCFVKQDSYIKSSYAQDLIHTDANIMQKITALYQTNPRPIDKFSR